MSEYEYGIAWEKWYDPFGADITEAEFPGAFGNFKQDEIMSKIKNGEPFSEDELEDNDDVVQAMSPQYNPQNMERPIKIVSTPFGIIPLTEQSMPSKIFNFWTMHTNFPITKSVVDVLNKTLGIETLDVFTPYRVRISIGKAFDTLEVKARIATNLNAKPIRLKDPGENSCT